MKRNACCIHTQFYIWGDSLFLRTNEVIATNMWVRFNECTCRGHLCYVCMWNAFFIWCIVTVASYSHQGVGVSGHGSHYVAMFPSQYVTWFIAYPIIIALLLSIFFPGICICSCNHLRACNWVIRLPSHYWLWFVFLLHSEWNAFSLSCYMVKA